MRRSLADIARTIADLSEYSAEIMPEATQHASPIRRLIKAFARFYASIHQRQYSRGQALHYFHEPRLSRFTPAGMGQFQTRTFRPCPVTQVDLLFAIQVAWYWAYILLRQSPRWLLRGRIAMELTALDLANLWVLTQHRGISHICTSAHFQSYVLLVGEMRRAGLITHYSGIQHGAWAKTKLDRVTRDTGYDEYTLLDERYLQPFHLHFDRAHHAIVHIQPPARRIAWQPRNRPHIAIALQNDDYDSDLAIAETCAQVASRNGIEVVIYVHPLPSTSEKVIQSFQNCGVLERGPARYGDSLCLVTRYSTLGMEFALQGGQAVFVDMGEQIVFDSTGLRTSVVSLAGLPAELDRAIAAQHTHPACRA